METRAEPRATPEAGGCETDVIGLTETFDAATDDEVEQGIVRLARDFPLADPGVWAYRPVSQSADCAIAAAWRAHLTAAPSFEMVEAAWGWCGHHDENAPRDVTESIAEALHARWHDTPSNRLWALIGQMVECRARLPSTLVRDILLKSGLGNFGLASARWALVRAAFAFGSGAGWILERKLSGAHMDECDVPGTTAAWIGSRQMAGDPIRQLDAKLWFRDGVVAESGDARTQKLARLVADLRSADRETSRRAFVSLARHHPDVSVFPAFWTWPGRRVVERAYFRVLTRRSSSVPSVRNALGMLMWGPLCRAMSAVSICASVHGHRRGVSGSLAAVGQSLLTTCLQTDAAGLRHFALRVTHWVARSSTEQEAGAAERMRDGTGPLERACAALLLSDRTIVDAIVSALQAAWAERDDSGVYRLGQRLVGLTSFVAKSSTYRPPNWRRYRRNWLDDALAAEFEA
jgi:hypothetical protein